MWRCRPTVPWPSGTKRSARSCCDFKTWLWAVLMRCWVTLILAEDVAQEVFITAWGSLPQLQQPDAFPGWFRRIILTQCNRLTRGKRLEFVPLNTGDSLASTASDPHVTAEKLELVGSGARRDQAIAGT